MKKRSWLFWLSCLLLLASMFVVKPAEVLACSCAEPPSVEESMQQKTAIFTGKVISLEQPVPGKNGLISSDAPVKATLEVTAAWKGKLGKETDVYTALHGASCGYEGFALGQEFIVFAYGEPERLETGLCEGTKPVSEAGTELAALGIGYAPSNDIKPTEKSDKGSTDDESLAMRFILSALILVVVMFAAVLLYFLIKRRGKRQ